MLKQVRQLAPNEQELVQKGEAPEPIFEFLNCEKSSRSLHVEAATGEVRCKRRFSTTLIGDFEYRIVQQEDGVVMIEGVQTSRR